MVTVLDNVDENDYRLHLDENRSCLAARRLAAGCGPATGAKGKTTVVASFYPLAFAAEQIGGAEVDVTNLTPAGSRAARHRAHPGRRGPHPDGRRRPLPLARLPAGGRAGARRRQRQADRRRSQASGSDAERRARPTRTSGSTPCSSRGSSGGSGPALGRPRQRATSSPRGSCALDRDYRDGLAHCARRDFVTSHAAFGYLAARYHLQPDRDHRDRPGGGAEPEALASLIDLVRRST